ncbi:MAG TPA: class I SAM-dependent methyltransferase [Acidimicrobiales bacterium]|jgi:SAM-dependent methyltransferase|nr:class I SAM-dependent methyltransferase [Acidimicrobiales bacterium]
MAESNRLLVRLGAQAVDALPPRLRRSVRSALGRPGPRPVAWRDLDAELRRATELMGPDPDAARALLDGIVLTLPAGPPEDPFSEAYRDWAWALYRAISGRAAYDTGNESSPFDLEAALARPFPYQTGSLALVGRDLVARGHLLGCLADTIPAGAGPGRVVEFGPGWGNLTRDLTATGLDVTAVELDEKFCRLIAHRCDGPGRVTVSQGDMLGFTAEEPFDAAVFFESFHHCADHLAMLRRLHDIVRPDGVVLFASEPIQNLAYPWGPRLDGLSVWSSRTYGWLELGFDGAYFDRALARTGWSATRHRLGSGAGETDVLVARPAADR